MFTRMFTLECTTVILTHRDKIITKRENHVELTSATSFPSAAGKRGGTLYCMPAMLGCIVQLLARLGCSFSFCRVPTLLLAGLLLSELHELEVVKGFLKQGCAGGVSKLEISPARLAVNACRVHVKFECPRKNCIAHSNETVVVTLQCGATRGNRGLLNLRVSLRGL